MYATNSRAIQIRFKSGVYHTLSRSYPSLSAPRPSSWISPLILIVIIMITKPFHSHVEKCFKEITISALALATVLLSCSVLLSQIGLAIFWVVASISTGMICDLHMPIYCLQLLSMVMTISIILPPIYHRSRSHVSSTRHLSRIILRLSML